MKNILIITHWFYPINNPRSFRARALSDELIKSGYNVDVLNGERRRLIAMKDLQSYYDECNIAQSQEVTEDICILKKQLKKCMNYLIGEKFFVTQIKPLAKRINHSYDVIISIGNPFYSHLLSIYLSKRMRKSPVLIGDCGDPFYLGPGKHSILVDLIQRYTFDKLNYVTIPIENAKLYYQNYLSENKIKIIPQGFSTENIKIAEYKKDLDCIHFAFAGTLYYDIRNPEKLLEYLRGRKENFEFTLYTSLNNDVYNKVLLKYKKVLGDKLQIFPYLKREDCIYQLSKQDFLINIENTTSIQAPSKLIDYSLAGRPIYSCRPDSSSFDVLDEFLVGDYSHKVDFNISKYKIETVCLQFEELFQ